MIQKTNVWKTAAGLYGDRLETTFQCGILFDVLAVLIQGCGTNNLDFTTAERRLQNIGGINGTLG